jgi:hypothetical protein
MNKKQYNKRSNTTSEATPKTRQRNSENYIIMMSERIMSIMNRWQKRGSVSYYELAKQDNAARLITNKWKIYNNLRKTNAIVRIQREWRSALYNPDRKLCKKWMASVSEKHRNMNN